MAPQPTSFLCRVDAGPQSGLGHLQRCLALADALARRSAEVLFLAPDLDDVRRRVDARGFRLLPAARDANTPHREEAPAHLLHVARSEGCETVIIDSYEIDDEYVTTLREAGLRVVRLDDTAAQPCSAHVVVNAAPGAGMLPYRNTTGDTQFLLGPQYALLSDTYRALPAPAIAARVERILVVLGGSAAGRVLPLVVGAVDRAAGRFDIVAVAGPFARSADAAGGERYQHHVRYVTAPDGLIDLILEADLAVSGGGQTLYEMAAAGTPAVAIRMAPNQSHNVQRLAADGVVSDAGCVSDPGFAERLSSIVGGLLEIDERARMSRAGQRMIDGRGATRVADAILGAVAVQ